MIIVRFDGGLGNQMSQYAFMSKLKLYYPSTEIKADYSGYKQQKIHNGFELMKVFNFTENDLPQASFFEILRAKGKIFFEGGKIIYQKYESGYPEDLSLYELPNNYNYYFNGTWHSNDYTDLLKNLREAFSFKIPLSLENQALKNDMINSNSVSIHVRRGDYVKEGLAIISKDYYKNAVNIIRERLLNQELDYYIFSDDKDFVKSYFDFLPAKNVHFVEGNSGKDSFVDMQLMSCCKHNIIANSTFSYWGAMLNSNLDKICIKPFMQTNERESWENEGWLRLR